MDLPPAPEVVSQRLKGVVAPAYLTLTSIIQGVALTTLVGRVEATYTRFDTTDWLLTITTFLFFLDIWHEYLMQILTYVWIPNLLDSLVPFGFLAAELFMAHFVYADMRDWLFAAAMAGVVGAAAGIVTNVQAHGFVDENREVSRVLAPHSRPRLMLIVGFVVLALCACALYDVLHLEHIRPILALAAIVAVIVFIGSTIPYWNTMLVYVQGERKPVRQQSAQE